VNDLVDTTEMYLRTILELEEEEVPALRARIAERLRQSGHDEACRWEHVMSEAVELKVYELLGRPTRSPYGNPIPGLNEFDGGDTAEPVGTLSERNLAFPGLTGTVTVSRICESVQTDADVLRQLHAAGMDPGVNVVVAQERDAVIVEHGGESVRLPREIASRVFVAAA
jgi:DtxR family Mn-dependent transcriptional regulator